MLQAVLAVDMLGSNTAPAAYANVDHHKAQAC